MGRKSTSQTGVRYREHRTRKWHSNPDRYFLIRYYNSTLKKYVEEPAGWASRGMNASRAARIRAEILGNIQAGIGPQSLREKKELDIKHREDKKTAKEKKEKLNITLDTVAQEYLDGLNESTKKANISRYNNHIKPVFGHVPLLQIDSLSLERFKRLLFSKSLAPKTVHHTLTVIRTIFRKAQFWGYYNGPIPTNKIEFPRVNNNRIRFLTHAEADLLLNELAKRSSMTHDQSLIALHCGLRAGEVRNMKWKDIDFDNDVIHLPETKTGESQQVFMTEQVKKTLLARLPENIKKTDYVFQGIKKKKQFKISDTFARTVEDLGFNEGLETRDSKHRVVFHTLRHTFCSWLAMQGTPLYTIQQLARHKTISQTERYSHLLPDQKQDAVKAMAEFFDNSRNNNKDAEVKLS